MESIPWGSRVLRHRRPSALWVQLLLLAAVLGGAPTLTSAQVAEDFTLIALPDTQYYTCQGTSSSCESGLGIFDSQTSWVEANRADRDIRFVTLLGDCAQNGNVTAEYDIADSAFQIIEAATSLDHPDGIPFGIAVGNHDQFPVGSPGSIDSISDVNNPDQATTTTTYNSYFGENRFCPGSLCRSYYGDHFGINNDNHYDLFSANGYDFVVVHIEYMSSNTNLRQAVIAWADNVLSTFNDRRAIVVTHNALGTGSNASFSNQGSAIYEGLKGNSNFFLMLGGHVSGEGQRSDTFNGNTVHTLLSDFQNRTNGGNGWLRILTFRPTDNLITVQTYSPFLDEFETDGDSFFTFSYDMSSGFSDGNDQAEAVTFQQGTDGYTGTVDTYIQVGTSAHGTEDGIFWDGSPDKVSLLRFESLFDSNGGPIPTGGTITSAVLHYVTDDGGNPADVYAVNHDWSDAVEYSGFGGSAGAQLGEDYDGPSIGLASGGTSGQNTRTERSVDVTSAVAAWSVDPDNNHGLVFIPTGSSGVGARSSEFADPADRPQLTVKYTLASCLVDVDCNDDSVCTTDTCVGGVCRNDAIAECCLSDAGCDDANACTLNSCDLMTNTCSNVAAALGSACGSSISSECNFSDTCDGAGTCLDNLLVQGSACGDSTSTECNAADSCDDVGVCQPNLAAAGLSCGGSGDLCTNADSCDGGGSCSPGLNLNCDDGDLCTADACDLVSGCANTAIPGCVPFVDASIVHFDFNETGNAPGSSGTDSRPIKMYGDSGGAQDFHSEDGEGVSGLPGDRSFANTGPSDQGRLASAATNGFRAEQTDNPAIDALSAFTVSGWFKTELDDSFLPNATPRLVNNHDGGGGSAGDGFNIQFLSGSEGDLKLEVNSDTGGGVSTEGTGERYSAKQTWVFFAVSYDGTETTDNVNFFVGFRDDAEAGGGVGSANVELVATGSLNRGDVDGESVGLRLANRPGDNRPFKGYLDEIRIDDVAHAGSEGLAVLESYRQSAVSPPMDVSLVEVSEWELDSSATGAAELSGITYDPDTGNFWTISDTGGFLLEIDVELDSSGAIVDATIVSSVIIADIQDYEGVAFTNSARNSVFLCEESDPGVFEYDRSSGALLQTLSVPAVFSDRRTNRGFEALARNADGTSLLVGAEQALTVDGPAGTSTTVETVSRLLRYSLLGNAATPAEQFAYEVEPGHASPVSSDGSSLSELVYLPNGDLLSIERSDAGGEILVRVFLTSTDGATDVSQGDLADGLIGESYTPLTKTLLFSDDRFGKFEGLALGPTLAGGEMVLVGVADQLSTTSDIRSLTLSLPATAECGNSIIESGEACDDGSTLPGDCCSALCQYESMGSACDDGAFCTDGDTCSGAGACVGGSPTDCSASSDTCNAGVCNEITNACEPQASNEGGACDDSSVCTLTDVCENGVCQSNLTLPCDDQNVCTDDICDPTTGCDNQIILECVQPVPAASDHGRTLLVLGMVSAAFVLLYRRKNQPSA